MALQRIYTAPSDVNLPEAYFRLVITHNEYYRKEAILGVYIYQNEASRRAERPFAWQTSYPVKNYPGQDTTPARLEYDAFMADGNTLNEQQRGYRHLKTLPGFAAAIDLLR